MIVDQMVLGSLQKLQIINYILNLEKFGKQQKMQFNQKFMKVNIQHFLYIINKRQYPQNAIHSLLIIFSNVYIFLLYLTSSHIKLLSIDIMVISDSLAYACYCLIVSIVLQILIGIIYGKQFYVKLQLKLVRYLVFLPLLRYEVNNIKYNTNLRPFSIIILMILPTLLFFLNTTLGKQSYKKCSILPAKIPKSSYHIIFQFFYCLLWLTDSSELERILVTMIFYIIVGGQLLANNTYACQNSQYKLIKITTNFYSLFMFSFVYKTLFARFSIESSIFFIIICALCFTILELYKINNVKFQVMNIFYPDRISAQQFLQRIEHLIYQIHKYSQTQSSMIHNSLIVSFCQLNQQINTNPYDILAIQTKKGLLKQLTQSKAKKNVLYKICRKIEHLFQQYCLNYPQNGNLRLGFLKFKKLCYENKEKMLAILTEIDSQDLDYFNLLEYYTIKKHISTIEISSSLDSIKDQSLNLFQNKISQTLHLMIEFWSQFLQEKVDLKKIFKISYKLLPCSQMLHQLAFAQTNINSLITVKILSLYAQFNRSILNDEMQANIVDDYIDILKKKLLQTKDFQHFLTDSQIGMIAISLSEVSLGSIQVCNAKAANIFDYNKQKLLQKPINGLMPKTFSQNHDEMLLAFMNNRNKKINTDSRILYGKNKFGYMIPISLQLQKSFNSCQQQLMFVAQISKCKLKQTPICCIINQQGQIEDYSSAFAYIFLKKKLANHIGSLNIEEIIPNFYNEIINSRTCLGVFSFNFKTQVQQKTVQIKFLVNEINFNHKSHAGFILKGQIQKKPYTKKIKNLTMEINSKFQAEKLIGYRMKYEPGRNCYIMSSQESLLLKDQQINFTIPFMLLSDMTKILDINQDKNKYDRNIRTIRLVGTHFQRVQQQQDSFQSDIFEQENRKADMKNKLKEMKQGIKTNERDQAMYYFGFVLSMVFLLIIGVIISIIVQFHIDNKTNSQLVIDKLLKIKIRGLISQQIVYCKAIIHNISAAQYKPIKEQISFKIIQYLNDVMLKQQQKQRILKILYLQGNEKALNLIDDQTLSFDLTLIKSNKSIILLGSIVGFYCLYTILQIVLIVYFKNKVLGIYSLFLTLEQKNIRRIYESCFMLIRKIQKQVNKFQDDSLFGFTKQSHEDDQQCPVQKIKKFKNTQREKQTKLFFKLIIPILLCLLLVTTSIIMILHKYKSEDIWIETISTTQSLISDSSVELLRKTIKQYDGINLNISSNFQSQIQTYEMKIKQLLENKNLKILTQLFYSNACKYIQNGICDQFLSGIMKRGVAKTLNFLSIYIEKQSLTPAESQKLITLQYSMIKPVLNLVSSHLLSERLSQIYLTNLIIELLLIALLIMTIGAHLYILLFPIRQMHLQNRQIKELIKILPPQHKNQLNSNGYQKIN